MIHLEHVHNAHTSPERKSLCGCRHGPNFLMYAVTGVEGTVGMGTGGFIWGKSAVFEDCAVELCLSVQ